MRNINIHLFKNREDNVVREPMLLSWAELKDIFSEHLITNEKNNMAFIAGNFKKCDYIPAGYNIYSEDGITLLSRKLSLDILGMAQVGRYAENVVNVEGIMLDYDGGEKIENIREKFKDITHLGYSSYNHKKDGVDKFRIFIPFSSPCPVEEFMARKGDMMEIAGECDKSSFTRARLFFVPACSKENKDKAVVWNVEGEWLNWEIFNRAPEPEPFEFKPLNGVGEIGGTGICHYETFDIVQLFKDIGLYIRSCGNRKHSVICPNYSNHSNGDKSGTVIYEGDGYVGGRPGNIHCAHGHCTAINKQLNELITPLLGKGWKRKYCITSEPLTRKFIRKS